MILVVLSPFIAFCLLGAAVHTIDAIGRPVERKPEPGPAPIIFPHNVLPIKPTPRKDRKALKAIEDQMREAS